MGDLLAITRLWVDQGWPIAPQQADEAARSLGWREPEEGRFILPYDVSQPAVRIGQGREEYGVTTINFRLTDVVMEASPERDAAMNDAFVGYVAAIKEVWGKPRMKRSKKDQDAFWELPNGVVLQVSNVWCAIYWILYSPSYAEVEKELGGLW